MHLTDFTSDVRDRLGKGAPWLTLLPKDPRRYLLESGESFTVYKALTDLLGLPLDHPDVQRAHAAVIADPVVDAYIASLPEWETHVTTSHANADYVPNQLWLLLDWGIGPRDDPRVGAAYAKLLAHQDKISNQFLAYCRGFKDKKEMWTSALCDHNLITSLLLLAGYQDDLRVKRGVERMSNLLKETSQGPGWKCEPGINTNFRGPGRKDDACPMATVDAMRGYWILPETEWPKNLLAAGNTLLQCWTKRAAEKPYMFGHGRNFRKLRPPFFWYNIGSVLDTTSHYPPLVRTQAFRELLAVGRQWFTPEGTIVPQSVYLPLKAFSFGQKKAASPWTTFFLSRICKRLGDDDLDGVAAVMAIDGAGLKGSKGAPEPGAENKDKEEKLMKPAATKRRKARGSEPGA